MPNSPLVSCRDLNMAYGVFCSGSFVAELWQSIMVAFTLFVCINCPWYSFYSTIKTFPWRCGHGKQNKRMLSHDFFFNGKQFFAFVLKENNWCLFFCGVLLSRICCIPLWVYQAVLLSYECFCIVLCLTYYKMQIYTLAFLKCNVVVKVTGSMDKTRQGGDVAAALEDYIRPCRAWWECW